MSHGNNDTATLQGNQCPSASAARLEAFGCTDAQISEGMRLASLILRDLRGVKDFTDEKLCEVFMEFIDDTDEDDPAEAILNMKKGLWGPDQSRWPEDAHKLGTVSAERVGKARLFLGVGAGGAMIGAGVSTLNPLLIFAGAAVELIGVKTAVHCGKTNELPRSPLAMNASNWKKMDIVEKGSKPAFTWEVTREGEQWTISRTRKDFSRLRNAMIARINIEKSGSYILKEPCEWPTPFHSKKTMQVRLDLWIGGVTEGALAQSILAELIHAFFQPTPLDKATFGPAKSVSSKAALAAAKLAPSLAPPTAAPSAPSPAGSWSQPSAAVKESSAAVEDNNAASDSGNDVAAKKGKSSRFPFGR